MTVTKISTKAQAKLADMIANPPEGSVRTQITPTLAAEMLAYNRDNRPVQKHRVSLYARQMRDGEWRYTREPIIFSDEGRVIDGQHRLMAVVDSGATITADVAFGAEDECFAFIDVGATRSSSDIFAINGVKNAKAIAAMARMVVNYDRGRQTISTGAHLTAAELYDWYLKLDEIDLSFTVVSRFKKAGIAPPALMGALHYICARQSRWAADNFFEEILAGGAGNSPARELHRRLVKNALSRDKMNADNLAGLVLTGWNRHRKGLSGRGLGFSGGKLPAAL